MDNVRWKELIVAAKPEIRRSAADMLIRGILAGVFLGFANIARFLCEFPGPATDRRIDSLPGWLRHARASRIRACTGNFALTICLRANF
jgi:hypothetical protein